MLDGRLYVLFRCMEYKSSIHFRKYIFLTFYSVMIIFQNHNYFNTATLTVKIMHNYMLINFAWTITVSHDCLINLPCMSYIVLHMNFCYCCYCLAWLLSYMELSQNRYQGCITRGTDITIIYAFDMY